MNKTPSRFAEYCSQDVGSAQSFLKWAVGPVTSGGKRRIENFPNDLCVIIFKSLSYRNLLTIPQVSKSWQKLAQEIIFPQGFEFFQMNFENMLRIITSYPLNDIYIRDYQDKQCVMKLQTLPDSIKQMIKSLAVPDQDQKSYLALQKLLNSLINLREFACEDLYCGALDFSKCGKLEYFRAGNINCRGRIANRQKSVFAVQTLDLSCCPKLVSFQAEDVQTPVSFSGNTQFESFHVETIVNTGHSLNSLISLPWENLKFFAGTFQMSFSVKFSGNLQGLNCWVWYSGSKGPSTLDLSDCTNLVGLSLGCYTEVKDPISIILPQSLPNLMSLIYINIKDTAAQEKLKVFQLEIESVKV